MFCKIFRDLVQQYVLRQLPDGVFLKRIELTHIITGKIVGAVNTWICIPIGNNPICNLRNSRMDNMVEKFMYGRINPESTGAEYKAIPIQMVVGGIDTFNWINNNLNILHRGTVFGYAHIQARLYQPQISFMLNVPLRKPFLFPFQITAKGIAGENIG